MKGIKGMEMKSSIICKRYPGFTKTPYGSAS